MVGFRKMETMHEKLIPSDTTFILVKINFQLYQVNFSESLTITDFLESKMNHKKLIKYRMCIILPSKTLKILYHIKFPLRLPLTELMDK